MHVEGGQSVVMEGRKEEEWAEQEERGAEERLQERPEHIQGGWTWTVGQVGENEVVQHSVMTEDSVEGPRGRESQVAL